MIGRILMTTGAADSVAAFLQDHSLSDTQTDPGVPVTGIRLLNDGTLQTRQGGAYVSDPNEWAVPRGAIGGLFNARLSRVAGDAVVGPSGWVPMTSTQTWELIGAGSFTGRLEVARGAVVVAATINLDNVLNTQTVNLENKVLTALAFDPGIASAAIRLLPDGTLQTRSSSDTAPFVSDPNEWLNPRGDGSLFEARLTRASGATPSGDLIGAWLNLGVARTWEIQAAAPFNQSFSGQLEIRRGGVVQDVAQITMTAQGETGF